ncbi:retrovirus-related pol polyprotein from transposon TNT 1-94 [Tanacetum coccineum]
MITTTNKVPLREPIPIEVVAQESVVTKVYTRRPKVPKTNGSNSNPKIAKSMISNKTEPDTSRGSDTLVSPSSSIVDLKLSKLFCDHEVAFGKHMCFIRNLEGVDLLSGSQETNLYTLSIGDVNFLASKDEAPDFIIKFLKMIQVRLNATVRNIRTDNGTEFVNQTLRSYYESVGIIHETLVTRSPQQNGVI